MSEAQAAPKLPKWPFYLADLVLSGLAAYVLTRLGPFTDTTQVVIAIGCLLAAAWGAWLSIMPWLTEYRTRSVLAESSNLKSTLEQIQSLEKVGDLIRQSNAQWQGVQDASGRTVTAAREISEKMKVETEEFMKFIDSARDQERAGLRLEVEKLRKMEGDWIKVTVQILDHIFALFRAAERSGQENLIQQLSQFQAACRDVARRMGLTPFVPAVGEKYDPRGHQLPNPPPVIDEQATIAEILAMGFTYQGQLLRRSLVLLHERPQTALMNPAAEKITEQIETEPDEVPMFAEDSPSKQADREGDASKRARGPQEPTTQNELPLV
jgi:molecular chaperone GrpE (heat shock protein)